MLSGYDIAVYNSEASVLQQKIAWKNIETFFCLSDWNVWVQSSATITPYKYVLFHLCRKKSCTKEKYKEKEKKLKKKLQFFYSYFLMNLITTTKCILVENFFSRSNGEPSCIVCYAKRRRNMIFMFIIIYLHNFYLINEFIYSFSFMNLTCL